MWKDYSASYIKNNRASGASVMIASFISALLLSLLGSLFYNVWVYEVEQTKMEEGDWQGRITGELSAEDLQRMAKHANVEKIVINEELSDGQTVTADVWLKHKRRIFDDLPRVARLAEDTVQNVSYHYALLNLYLIRSAEDTALRWVFPFSLLVTAAACLSLVMVIHNAFAVSMHARIHQFGILSSIGATPGQIRTCLLQEAAVLCAAPVAAGSLSGILLCMGICRAINVLMADVQGRLELPFCYHPLLFGLSLLAAAFTVGLSAWIPAAKMSRLTPLEAIRNTGELQLKRRKNSRMLSALFGIEGELAGNALKAQKKTMRTATLSLVFSFLAFSFMMCFFTITMVSQRETYFFRYQDAWDVMVTVKDTDIDAFEKAEALRQVEGVRSSVAYQKASARRIVSEEEISEEMRAAGGFAYAQEPYGSAVSGGWLVHAPLVIMEDAGFLEYCEQIGAESRLDGAVILNRTKDAADPNFRKRRILPYLLGDSRTTVLRRDGQSEEGTGEGTLAEIPVIAYTLETPVLREEYGTQDFYELVHFIPVSLWKEIKEQIGGAEADTYIRILAEEGAAQGSLDKIEETVTELLGRIYGTETENRLREVRDNDRMFAGMKAILSVFCILLAAIGIGNVFSNTFGFVRQRRREFARYLSVGLTPGGMRKLFFVEALVVAGRPVLIALPVTGAAVAFFLKVSYLEPMLFVREAPFLPVLIFILAIFGFVALAYYLGAKKVLGSDLAEALRDDTVL